MYDKRGYILKNKYKYSSKNLYLTGFLRKISFVRNSVTKL